MLQRFSFLMDEASMHGAKAKLEQTRNLKSSTLKQRLTAALRQTVNGEMDSYGLNGNTVSYRTELSSSAPSDPTAVNVTYQMIAKELEGVFKS